jgi:quinol monooxygenase YgiN
MYVVAVEFDILEQDLNRFMPLMLENARSSLAHEPGCRQFDVCVDPKQGTSTFLYEVYDDRAAFEAHLATSHFKTFDAATRAMVARKAVRLLERLHP